MGVPVTNPFVGRVRELGLLEADLDAAAAGRGGLTLIAGEPGIGKTRLADRVATLAAQRGFTAYWGSCWQGGGAPAFWPWIQILRASLSKSARHDAANAAEWTSREIETLIGPAPSDEDATERAASAASSDHARFRLFDAIASHLQARASDGPLLLVLDDLHDADEPSLLLLQFLVRDLHRSSIFIVGTCREAELLRSPVLMSAFAALSRDSRRLALRGLDRSELDELIDRTSDASFDARLKDVVCAMTEGNPYFVDEVVRMLLARPGTATSERVEIPFTVKEAIRQRLAPLGATSRKLLDAAAAIGRDFDLGMLARVVARPREECRAALDEAAREGLVVHVGGDLRAWRFVHVLVCETLRDDTAAAALQQIHMRIATLLAEDRRLGREVHRASLAHHLVEARPLADTGAVLDALVDSGREAMSRLAYEEAVRDFAGAAEILEDHDDSDRLAEVLLELGYARRCSGQLVKARETYRIASSLLRSAIATDATPVRRALFARAVLGFSRVSETGEVDEEVVALLEEALAVLGAADSPVHASVLARLAMALYFTPDPARCLDLGRRAVDMARRIGDRRAQIHALVSYHFALWRPGTAAERLQVADQLIDLCERAKEREAALEARAWRVTDLLELGEGFRADREFRRYDADAQSARLPVHRWHASMLRSTFAWLSGRVAQAEREADAALATGLAAELPNARAFHLAQLYQVRAATSRLAELEPLLRRVSDLRPSMAIWAVCAAEAALAAGRVEDARHEYERFAADGFASVAKDGMWLASLSVLSRLAARLDDCAGAAKLYELLAPHAETWVVSVTAITVTGPVHLFLGMLASAKGETEDARRHLEIATQQCRRLGYSTLVSDCESELARLAGAAAATQAPAEAAGERSAVFRRGTDFWTLSAGGRALRLRDSKGLRYIHYLLENPERDFHVFDLVTAVEGSPPAVARASTAEHLSRAGEGDTGPVVDAAAMSDYRRRLREVRSELAEAEALNDAGRVELLAVEREFLERELEHAVGLGGRRRKSGSPSEQVRVRVTKVIGLAMRRIAQADPALGRVLAREIHTGTFCAYRPDPDRPVRWITTAE